MKTIIIIISLICFSSTPVFAYNNGFKKYSTNNQYDLFFHKYSKELFGITFDWLLFKSQAIAESRLNDNARSPVGAQGIMQIMPNTFDEIKRRDAFVKGSVYDPKINIRAGIWYDCDLWKHWGRKTTFTDRVNFMFGSYNAGRGNIIDSQKYCISDPIKYGDPHSWSCIDSTLHKVTGCDHSTETKDYIKRITLIYNTLRGE